MIDKLNQLKDKCKASVSLEINPHRNSYETVMEYLEDTWQESVVPEIDTEVLKKMIETNTLIELQYYPDSPIGFLLVHHYDIEKAIDAALDSLK